jgi:hypothetical protein
MPSKQINTKGKECNLVLHFFSTSNDMFYFKPLVGINGQEAIIATLCNETTASEQDCSQGTSCDVKQILHQTFLLINNCWSLHSKIW